jgi:hypothetical protein
LNILGWAVITTAIVFLIYSILSKNKVSAKFRDSFIILNEYKFLSLKLYCSIFNLVGMIIFGIIVIRYNLPGPYVTAYPLLYRFVNYLIIPIGRTKQYIKYK